MRRKSSKEVVRVVSDYLNIISDDDEIGEFVEGFSNEHRTLQQGFTRLTMAWLRHLASLGEYQYDGRNEASVKLAKKLLEGHEDHELHLPLI